MNPRITSVKARRVDYPVRGRFKFLEDAQGRPSPRPSIVIQITADNGVSGWGQSVPVPRWSYETPEAALAVIERYLGPALIGCDPTDLEAAHAIMSRVIAPSFSTGHPITKAGIDIALHDLAGRIHGAPVTRRWNPNPLRRIQLSWTLNPTRLDEVEGLVAQGMERGYRHFNIKVAPDPSFDLELCRMVRGMVPDGFLWVDANGGYDEAAALAVAPRLADIGVPVLEQPYPANRLSAYRRLKQQGALPILMDEGIVSSVELGEFIQLGLLDGVAVKVARCGGLTEAYAQVSMLRERGLLVLGSGLTDPDLSLAASLALYGAMDLAFPAALNGPQFLETSILDTPLVVRQGVMEVPEGSGLGVTVLPGKGFQD